MIPIFCGFAVRRKKYFPGPVIFVLAFLFGCSVSLVDPCVSGLKISISCVVLSRLRNVIVPFRLSLPTHGLKCSLSILVGVVWGELREAPSRMVMVRLLPLVNMSGGMSNRGAKGSRNRGSEGCPPPDSAVMIVRIVWFR